MERLAGGYHTSLMAGQLQCSGCLASSKQLLLPAEEIPATGSHSAFLNQGKSTESLPSHAEEFTWPQSSLLYLVKQERHTLF